MANYHPTTGSPCPAWTWIADGQWYLQGLNLACKDRLLTASR
jgi:hypothetical protein